ncbi:hypothetical protein AAG906_029344 [Vitis piasezkii]|uniref:Uncharacterized protein n=1 Tax=Vitis vinifera TaxID=29760 RepID=A0A438HT29_VITVI|nr:hypothetical protein CK203_041163 [Vitis vinifera]
MLVPHTIPIRAAWSDDRMKKMVHAELQDYGDFGLTNEDEVEEETSDVRILYIYSFI